MNKKIFPFFSFLQTLTKSGAAPASGGTVPVSEVLARGGQTHRVHVGGQHERGVHLHQGDVVL